MVKLYNTIEARRALMAKVPIAAARTMAAGEIDAAAERARLAYLTPGDGQALVYRQKQKEAAAIIAASAPDPADYSLAAGRATRLGTTIQDVAAEWDAQAKAWLAIAAAIEDAREGGKEAVKAAPDLAAVEEARDAALAALRAIEGAAGQ